MIQQTMRRRRGRAIRRARKRYPLTPVPFVTVAVDVSAFTAAVAALTRRLDALSRAYESSRPILHNGRKARR